jgi:hypothetical protein
MPSAKGFKKRAAVQLPADLPPVYNLILMDNVRVNIVWSSKEIKIQTF